MTNQTSPKITPIEDLATARWLVGALADTRVTVQAGPSGDAVERIRMRVFGAQRKELRTLAA